MNRKTIFLSFTPTYYPPLLSGVKKYEYRKRFCKEPTLAYLYLSSPVKKVVAKMELGTPLLLETLKEDFQHDKFVLSRIVYFIDHYQLKYAVPIEQFTLLEEVSLKQLQSLFDGFFPPRSYQIIDNNLPLLNFLNSLNTIGTPICNSHEVIYTNNIGVSYNEFELSPEFEPFLMKDEE